MIKKFVKNTMIITAFLVAVILISSSSMSITIRNISKPNKLYFTEVEEEISNGLAPPRKKIPVPSEMKSISTEQVPIGQDCYIMYGYKAYPTPEKIINFDTCEPGEIEEIAPTGSDDFIAGATCSMYNEWFGCENGSGKLWEIDIETGEMTLIGGGGVNLNGLAWDPIYNRMYGSSDDNYLYEVDPDTGEQEKIGAFGNNVEYMIGMAFDADGTLYGWDLGNDKLWTIDTETGEAYEIGPLGIDLNYAQDGDFHRESDTLYLTAYTTTGQLYVCDKETGECELIGNFENDIQITGSIFYQGCPCVEHDVALKGIDYPNTGPAGPDMKMQVTVRNEGNNTETFSAQMEINKNQSSSILMEEDFSGPFPPEGWETDSWVQCNDSCSPDPPCACLYPWNQVLPFGGNITSKAVNASEYKKLRLTFYFAADLMYPQYSHFYVKFRMNESSPWKDITPWDNPLNEQKEGDIYVVDFYGISGFGEALQIKWEYVGYYYYYNYCVLDSVTLEATNDYTEYAELVEDITLGSGESKQIEFPSWTPSQWQDPDYENTWVDYSVHAFTIMEGDQNPRNNCKEKNIDLYFPWMHDIEITSIDSPCEDGPGKTLPVEATIKNVGQYAECCIPIDIEIGEPILLDTLLTENAWDTVPPAGWYDEHKDFSNDYGWNKSYTAYSGGSSPEAILRYDQALPDHVLYSYAINTSDYSNCRFEFKSYINHFSGQGLYALEAGYSNDGETWYAIWHEEPRFSRQYDVECSIEGGHETLYIGFWVTGDPWYFNYWYLDDISLKAFNIVSEYSDSACQSDELEPGESRIFEFDDWTPDFLQYETSGLKDYIIQAEINMEGDKNPSNDIKSVYFTLDYWHDVGIEGSSSHDDILWDNGEPDGRNALQGSIFYGYSNILIDDFELDTDVTAMGGQISLVWNSGAGTGNLDTLYMWFFEETGDCEPSLDEYAKVEVNEFSERLTGDYYFNRPEVEITVEFEEVELPAGHWWIGFQPDSIGEDIAYLLTAESKGCEVMADLPYWGYPRWTSSSYIWDSSYDLSWNLWSYTCCGPWIKKYIQPGTESIDGTVKNFGTFKELNLTCNAQIWDYITDPEGTLQYEDNVTNIDLDEPLGGTVNLTFNDFTFENEGRYGLILEMPAPNDDKPQNNKKLFGIGVDDTNPVSDHTLYPPEPDGENGWYVNDLEVTLQAEDPYVKDVSSGVKEIKYRVNGGPVNTITGPEGTFLLTQENDGDDVEVEYWAIDNVGNTEGAHTFTIDMDQTEPTISLTYKVTGGNPNQGWTVLCTAFATDATSGMDRVEFFLNGVLQETVIGSGPEYQWGFRYYGGLNLIVTAEGFDIAGNMASDKIDPVKNTYNQNTQQQSQSQKSSNYKSQQKLFFISGWRNIDD